MQLCCKANQKLCALARIAKYLNINKQKIILNSFTKVKFNYCPLIWMCLSGTLNNKTNRMQEGALRIVYDAYKSNSMGLLERDHSSTIHERNIQYLTIEA